VQQRATRIRGQSMTVIWGPPFRGNVLGDHEMTLGLRPDLYLQPEARREHTSAGRNEEAKDVRSSRRRWDGGRIDNGLLLALTGHAGAAKGKRLKVRHFLGRSPPGARGMPYTCSRSRRHEHGRGIRDVVLGAWLRDSCSRPTSRRCRPAHGRRARDVPRRPRGEDGSDVSPSPRQVPARASLAPLRAARLDRLRRHSSSSGVTRPAYEQAWRKAYRTWSRPTTQRRLSMLGTPVSTAGSAASAKRGGRRMAVENSKGEVQLRPARDQLPLLRTR